MPQLHCTVKRVGDHESRTEEYEVAYALGRATPRVLIIKYQAARAYEINAALDAAVEVAREAIAEADPPPEGAHRRSPRQILVAYDPIRQIRTGRAPFIQSRVLRAAQEGGSLLCRVSGLVSLIALSHP